MVARSRDLKKIFVERSKSRTFEHAGEEGGEAEGEREASEIYNNFTQRRQRVKHCKGLKGLVSHGVQTQKSGPRTAMVYVWGCLPVSKVLQTCHKP